MVDPGVDCESSQGCYPKAAMAVVIVLGLVLMWIVVYLVTNKADNDGTCALHLLTTNQQVSQRFLDEKYK